MRFRQAPSTKQDAQSRKTPLSPRGGGVVRDARFGRPAPLPAAGETDRTGAAGARGGGPAAPTSKPAKALRLAPSLAPKSLLPVSEQKSQEENKLDWRARKDADVEPKWDITPDGGSAGREGRQFTVANVGNNGRIYLR